MQDPNPLPWGTQDRFQAHYIIRKNVDDVLSHTARTVLSTKGHFAGKKVVGVKWNGGQIAESLNADSELNQMIQKQTVNDATIFIDPTDSGVRIYGKWKDSFGFKITKEMFEIYDKIAGHIKKL